MQEIVGINNHNDGNQYHILAVELVETKRYKEMVNRPYDVQVTDGEMGVIEDVVTDAVQKGIKDSYTIANYIANKGTNILLPTATNIKKTFIANGWNTERFAFRIVLECKIPGTNASTINYIQGYSEFLDISYNGKPDPNMAMYINSVTVLRKVNSVTTVIGNYGTMLDETGEIMKQITSERVQVTRPEDIMSRISATYSDDSDGDVKYISNLGNVNEVQIVSNDIVNPLGHVAETISSTINTTKMYGLMSKSSDILDGVVGNLSASNPLGIDFFKILYKIYGTVTNNFLLKDLKDIDPYMPAPNVVLSNGRYDGSGILPYDGADTYDATIETRMAELVRVVVREVLNYSSLSSISFTIENTSGFINYRLDGVPTTIIPGVDVITAGEIFMEAFARRIWNTLTNNNNTEVILKVYVLGTDITLFITVDGGIEIPYVYPIFADSKLMPIQMDQHTQDMMAEGYRDIVTTSKEVTRSILQNRSNDIASQFGIQQGGYFGQ